MPTALLDVLFLNKAGD